MTVGMMMGLYSIYLTVQYDNYWNGATDLKWLILSEDVVCISDCPGDIVDSAFHQVSPTKVSELLLRSSWFTYLDFELFTLDSGRICTMEEVLVDCKTTAYEHGSNSEVMEIYVRVYTDQPDDVMYNLSEVLLG